jgi:hypothetical protein
MTMTLPHHITIDRRVLTRLAIDPCNAWNWYEAAKMHGCRDLEDLWLVTGHWLVNAHVEAALSGLGLYLDRRDDARPCSPHPRPVEVRYEPLPAPKAEPRKRERTKTAPVGPPPLTGGVVEL